MRLIAKMLSLAIVCGFAISAAPVFAGNYCPILLQAENEACNQGNRDCLANVQNGCSDPNQICGDCQARTTLCRMYAEDDYYDCTGTSVPPPCSGPLCGVAYRPRAIKKFDPNHLVLNLVFPTTPATANKSAVQIRRSCNGS